MRIFRETLLADDGLPGWVDGWVTPVTGCPVWIHLISSRVSGDQENPHFFGIVEAVGTVELVPSDVEMLTKLKVSRRIWTAHHGQQHRPQSSVSDLVVTKKRFDNASSGSPGHQPLPFYSVSLSL